MKGMGMDCMSCIRDFHADYFAACIDAVLSSGWHTGLSMAKVREVLCPDTTVCQDTGNLLPLCVRSQAQHSSKVTKYARGT